VDALGSGGLWAKQHGFSASSVALKDHVVYMVQATGALQRWPSSRLSRWLWLVLLLTSAVLFKTHACEL
jgi:hypothetical protein